MSAQERLQKALAAAGLGSRRKCEALIVSGRVKVNGVTAELGDRIDASIDKVSVDGILLDLEVAKEYYLLNKPAGYITTLRDTGRRPTVMDLIHEETRLFPVGRLDKDTRGLLLLTNDGYLAQKLTHPSHGVEKTYTVEAEGYIGDQGLARLRKGIDLEEGRTAPSKVKVLAKKGDRCVLEITIHEGKKRQVRRMCAAVGLVVKDLIRVRLGPLDLKGVEEGSYRPLQPAEIKSLMELDEVRG
jgi:23S rRNA pseudouridine2605 synthase